MIDLSKIQNLKAYLGALPESVAVRLAHMVEIDRLSGGKGLPHGELLDGLRPVLRRARGTGRVQSPQRLWCSPFEDLLTSIPRKEKQAGRIARSSIAPVWEWLSKSLLPAETTTYCEAVTADLLSQRGENARARARQFWTIASGAILDALDTPDKTEAPRALGSAQVAADAREMALVTGIGREVEELRERLPRPTQALSDDFVRYLRALYEAVLERVPNAAAYIAVVAMSRLDQPWEVLRLPLRVSRQTQDTLISNTDIGMVGEILFSDIEYHAAQIRSVRLPLFDADELLCHLAAFAKLSSGMVNEIEIRRDGRWGQRLLRDRAALAEDMDNHMKRSVREIMGALPCIKTGAYAGGPRAPDISHALDPEKYQRAITYAKLVSGSRNYAAGASFAASHADAQDEVTQGLRVYSEDILRELRASEGQRRGYAEQYFGLTVELTAMLLSAEEGEFLRRRGRVATGTYAAA
jgi:hypothetical protein